MFDTSLGTAAEAENMGNEKNIDYDDNSEFSFLHSGHAYKQALNYFQKMPKIY